MPGSPLLASLRPTPRAAWRFLLDPMIRPSAPSAASPRTTEGGFPPTLPFAPAPLRRSLRSWYLRKRRDLPWRGTRDPWAIWVSEVMLQQTTVAVGRVRYPAFLERFPTVESLAKAAERDVLAAWSGLGYYSRARNLWRAAHEALALGGIPRAAAALARLPGVGPYTAAAIASIAFGEAAAVVDGNVLRVVARLLAEPLDPKASGDRRRARSVAQALLDPKAPGDHNQAVMELGALVCTPRTPACPACPVRRSCAAFRLGRPEDFPPRPPRKPPRRLRLAAGVALRRGRLVLLPDDVFVPGHLVVPVVLLGPGEDAGTALRSCWEKRTGRPARRLTPLGRLSHSVLDRRYDVALLLVTEGPPVTLRPRVTLLSPEAVRSAPRGGFLEKVLARLATGARPGPGRRAPAPPRRTGG